MQFIGYGVVTECFCVPSYDAIILLVVCLSITGGQWKLFDLKTQEAVSLAIER